MNKINKLVILTAIVFSVSISSCKKNDTTINFDTSGSYMLADQMGRPAINTVFVNSARKDEFNTTIPTMMNAAFNAQFQTVLTNFGYTTNALGMNKATFAGILVNDVLNVKMNGTTTFFDGVNVLTGRALGDDVIDTELLLIFGGPAGTSNPGLTKDNVNANDKPFLASFPFLASPN